MASRVGQQPSAWGGFGLPVSLTFDRLPDTQVRLATLAAIQSLSSWQATCERKRRNRELNAEHCSATFADRSDETIRLIFWIASLLCSLQ